jgi:hypothetical protein
MYSRPMYSRRAAFAALIVLFSMSAAFAADAPSLDAAQAAYGAGDYRKSLQEIARLLNSTLPGTGPGTQTRYDAFMLRGECLLQLKEPTLAVAAFNSASNVSKQDPHPGETAAARGLAMLVQASPGLKYAPKSADASPAIDITQPDSRKKALAAMFDDRLAEVKPLVEKAMKGNSLVPMMELLPKLRDLYSLEWAATGKADVTLPIGKAMGERARDLINAELDKLNKRIAQLEDLANEPMYSDNGGFRGQTASRRGLTSTEQDELKDAAAYLEKIRQVAQEGRRINRRLGGTGEAWDKILADVGELEDRAQVAYNNK